VQQSHKLTALTW